jgi:hypothetical protein
MRISLLLLILVFSHFGLIVFVSVYFSVILLDSDFAFSVFFCLLNIYFLHLVLVSTVSPCLVSFRFI